MFLTWLLKKSGNASGLHFGFPVSGNTRRMSFASEYPRPGSLGSWSNRKLQWIKFTATNLWGISVRVREKEPPAGGHSPPPKGRAW